MSKPITLPAPAFDEPKHHIRLFQGDCLEILALLPENSVDLVFADPPYFLSNGGITCHARKMVSVHKGDWDKSRGADANHEFNKAWLAACQRVFWAAKNKKSRHTFNYKLMKETNRGKQMKSVWEIKPPEKWEKSHGKHPAQKPVALLERILLASTNEGDLVLDPFCGSETTAVAALRTGRTAVGLELSYEYLSLTVQRLSSELIRVALSCSVIQFSLDLFADSVDRSDRAIEGRKHYSAMSLDLKLVQQECRFYFIGRNNREVIFAVHAVTLEVAREKFRASGGCDGDTLFIIKTETQIFLA